MKIFLSEECLAAMGVDLVIEKEAEGCSYWCALDRSKVDKNSELPVEQQNCWSIRRITETTGDNVKITEIKYPNGSRNYVFAAAMCSEYNYDYKY